MASGLTVRARIHLAVAVMAVLPGPIVWLVNLNDLGAGVRSNAERTADEAAALAREGPVVARADALRALAARHTAWIRVVDAGGGVVFEAFRERASSWWAPLARPFFGRAGLPGLRASEAGLPPVAGRAETAAARRGARLSGCESRGDGGAFLVCFAARRAGAHTAYVVDGSPRPTRHLLGVRYAMPKLAAALLALGLLASAWLARGVVAPLHALRTQVLRRAARPRGCAPIRSGRRDELGDLADAYDALLAALDAQRGSQEAFVADLAHELKHPAAAVLVCAEALADAGGGLDATRTSRLAAALRQSGRRLDAAVRGALDLARAEAGFPSEARVAVDLDAVLREVAASIEVDPRFEGVRCELEVSGARAFTRAAPAPLEAALRNVLENGASFAGPGGRVRVRVEPDGDALRVTVRDSGPGISVENLPRVFDRFFTTRAGSGGTGLGLAFTRAVVEAHGGSITARSAAGEGAAFEIELRRAPEA